jgi:hypothetical protein
LIEYLPSKHEAEFKPQYHKKKKGQTRAGSMAQMVEHLPSKHKALSTNPYTTFFFWQGLGFELRVYILSHSISPFLVMDFFEIGSGELFPQAGFKLRSSDLHLLSS